MIGLIQRVSSASAAVDGEIIGEIGRGVLLLLGVEKGDSSQQCQKLADKVMAYRIFADDDGKMNRSVLDIGGSVLVVSQFTLAADTSRGNRPGFSTAAHPSIGEPLYEYFADQMRAQGLPVAQGQFGADMKVSLVNDGPITIWMEN